MGLLKEPINVDFSNKSEPWTEEELLDFRRIIQHIKAKNIKKVESKPKGKRISPQHIN